MARQRAPSIAESATSLARGARSVFRRPASVKSGKSARTYSHSNNGKPSNLNPGFLRRNLNSLTGVRQAHSLRGGWYDATAGLRKSKPTPWDSTWSAGQDFSTRVASGYSNTTEQRSAAWSTVTWAASGVSSAVLGVAGFAGQVWHALSTGDSAPPGSRLGDTAEEASFWIPEGQRMSMINAWDTMNSNRYGISDNWDNTDGIRYPVGSTFDDDYFKCRVIAVGRRDSTGRSSAMTTRVVPDLSDADTYKRVSTELRQYADWVADQQLPAYSRTDPAQSVPADSEDDSTRDYKREGASYGQAEQSSYNAQTAKKIDRSRYTDKPTSQSNASSYIPDDGSQYETTRQTQQTVLSSASKPRIPSAMAKRLAALRSRNESHAPGLMRVR